MLHIPKPEPPVPWNEVPEIWQRRFIHIVNEMRMRHMTMINITGMMQLIRIKWPNTQSDKAELYKVVQTTKYFQRFGTGQYKPVDMLRKAVMNGLQVPESLG